MVKRESNSSDQVIGAKKKMVKTQERSIPIPEEVILNEILPRLPIKSVFRFQLVCKKWASFISTPGFRQTHFSLTSPHPPDHFILLNAKNQCYCLSYGNELKGLDLLENDVSSLVGGSEIDMVGSCDGLVCFNTILKFSEEGDTVSSISSEEGDTGSSIFTVWNPVTREFHKTEFPSLDFWACVSGFGYVSGFDDYKIFAISSPGYDDVPYVGVFSLRSGQWREISDSIGDFDVGVFLKVYDSRGVFFESGLYWSLEKKGYGLYRSLERNDDALEDFKVVEFDFVNEQLKLIPVLDSSGYESVAIHVIQERLSLCCRDRDWVLDLVMLKRQGNGYAWEKLYSFSNYQTRRLGFTTISKQLIQHARQLKLVDSVHNPRQCSGIGFEGQVRCAQPYVQTLLSPL